MPRKHTPKQFAPHIYGDWKELLIDLPADVCREIFMAILDFPNNTTEPNSPIWRFIKTQLQKDYDLFEEKCAHNRQSANSRWGMRMHTNACERMQTDTNACVGMPKRITNNDNKKEIINNTVNNLFNNNQFVVNDSFSIPVADEPFSMYARELGTDIVRQVERWLIKNKNGATVDKNFICKQFINFAQRQGKPLLRTI